MKFREFALLADENVAAGVVRELRGGGIDIVAALESLPAGSSDEDVLALSVRSGRAVLTFDADFGSLAIVQQKPIIGIAYLRPGHLAPELVLESLRVALAADIELTPPFLLVIQRSGDVVTIRRRSI